MNSLKSLHPLVSVIIPTMVGGEPLLKCVESVSLSEYANIEIIIINNGNPQAVALVKNKFNNEDWLRILTPPQNLFFAKSINLGIENCRGDFIFVFNDDAWLDKKAISFMMKTLLDHQHVVAVHAKVISAITNQIDSVGGIMDWNGFAYKQTFPDTQKLFYVSLGLFRKSILSKVHGYDSEMVIYWEDVDVGWKINLSGGKIRYIPEAIIYHAVSSTTSLQPKFFNMYHTRKNRLMGLLKNYAAVNVLLFVPLLLIQYVGLVLLETIKHKNLNSIRATAAAVGWNIANIKSTLKKRNYVQKKIRKVSDREIFKHMIAWNILGVLR